MKLLHDGVVTSVNRIKACYWNSRHKKDYC